MNKKGKFGTGKRHKRGGMRQRGGLGQRIGEMCVWDEISGI